MTDVLCSETNMNSSRHLCEVRRRLFPREENCLWFTPLCRNAGKISDSSLGKVSSWLFSLHFCGPRISCSQAQTSRACLQHGKNLATKLTCQEFSLVKSSGWFLASDGRPHTLWKGGQWMHCKWGTHGHLLFLRGRISWEKVAYFVENYDWIWWECILILQRVYLP